MVRYEVYCQDRFVGVYLAKSAEEAIKKATSSQSGNATHLYNARIAND